jgi:hypothetical protein
MLEYAVVHGYLQLAASICEAADAEKIDLFTADALSVLPNIQDCIALTSALGALSEDPPQYGSAREALEVGFQDRSSVHMNTAVNNLVAKLRKFETSPPGPNLHNLTFIELRNLVEPIISQHNPTLLERALTVAFSTASSSSSSSSSAAAARPENLNLSSPLARTNPRTLLDHIKPLTQRVHDPLRHALGNNAPMSIPEMGRQLDDSGLGLKIERAKSLTEKHDKQKKSDSRKEKEEKPKTRKHQLPISDDDEDEDEIEAVSTKSDASFKVSSASKRPLHRIGRKVPFSEVETENLIAGVRAYGKGDWRSILDSYAFDERTTVDLKDKWRTLERKGDPRVKEAAEQGPKVKLHRKPRVYNKGDANTSNALDVTTESQSAADTSAVVQPTESNAQQAEGAAATEAAPNAATSTEAEANVVAAPEEDEEAEPEQQTQAQAAAAAAGAPATEEAEGEGEAAAASSQQSQSSQRSHGGSIARLSKRRKVM